MAERTAFERAPEGAQHSHAADSLKDAAKRYAPLWPLILGLAFGRAGIITSSYGSYASTDEGLLTDGATLVALAFLGVLLIILAATKHTLSKRSVNRIMRVCVVVESVTLLCQAAIDAAGAEALALRFGLSVISSITAAGVIYYWLRRTRGSGMGTATVLVFTALPVSEVEIYVCAMLPAVAANCLAGGLALIQLPCMRWARKQDRPDDIPSLSQTTDYFGFAKTMITSTRFLIATAVGIGFLSVVVGLLRGYPDGGSIAFSFATRTAYGLLTIALSLGIVLLVLKGRPRVMTVGIFLLMEGLAGIALILYAAFPGALDVGAVFTTTLNALLNAFTWYVIIAFMSCGWRDPYYYALAGRLVLLGGRACARMFLLFFYPLLQNDVLLSVLISTIVLASAQVVLVQFLGINRQVAEEQGRRSERQNGMLTRLMGLDEHENLASIRQASMQRNAEEMGRQFLLSDREVEVMALYALGYTQKRVAEELFITPGTAHAHIKRIYAKTGLHSRQEILDYMQQYAS